MHFLTPVGLAMKLPEETKDDLFLKRTAVPLRYFAKGPVKKEYAVFPGDAPQSSAALHGYVRQSIEYALKLPKPKKTELDNQPSNSPLIFPEPCFIGKPRKHA